MIIITIIFFLSYCIAVLVVHVFRLLRRYVYVLVFIFFSFAEITILIRDSVDKKYIV